MNFNEEGFQAFQRDVERAVREVCEKHQLKLTGTRISYGKVDFDLKLSFEKNEEGLNAERIKFENECSYYGFEPEDYLRLLVHKGEEYEFLGFERGARKYNCIVRSIMTGETIRINNRYLSQLFEQEISEAAKEQEQPQSQPQHQPLPQTNCGTVNLLSEQELALLDLKLAKSKRNEKDWTLIKETLLGKALLTYRPDSANYAIGCKGGIAVENGFLVVFTREKEINRHLTELGMKGLVGAKVPVMYCVYEEVIRIAIENRMDVLFDISTETNRGYYTYDVVANRLKVMILAENSLGY